LAEAEVSREGTRLARDAFHQVAVAGKRPDPVVHHLVAGPVEAVGHQSLRDRHADGVADPLAERPGGGLDAGGETVLGVARRLRSPLAEAPDLLEREG